MERKVNAASTTTPSRINRRTILKGAAAGAAATTLGAISKRSTFAAPAFLQAPTIVFALGQDDAPKIQPLVDDYQAMATPPSSSSRTPLPTCWKAHLNLTQATGAYDVVSMDDPWMPQFAGGEFLMNLAGDDGSEGHRGRRGFHPRISLSATFQPGAVCAVSPGSAMFRSSPGVRTCWKMLAWRCPQDLGRRVAHRPGDHRRQWRRRALWHWPARAGGQSGRHQLPSRCVATVSISSMRTGSRNSRRRRPRPPMETQLALAKLAPPGVENVGHAENGTNM